jgi:uncharacterized protein YcgI (DUF1989 family)
MKIIPNGSAEAFEVSKGKTIKICVPKGAQVADLTFPNFNQSLTRDMNSDTRQIDKALEGTILYDGAGKGYLKLFKSASLASHDLLFPGCRKEMYKKKLGCRNLLSKALNIPLEALPSVCSFFMDVKDGKIMPSSANPGDYVLLEALENVKIGISSCPDKSSSPSLSEVWVEIK